MIGARHKHNRPGSGALVELKFGHDVARRGAMKIRPARERSDSGIAGGQPCALGRKIRVMSAGPNDDPMRVVTGLFWKMKFAAESCSRFEFECLSAIDGGEGSLKIVAGMNQLDLARCGSIRQGALHVHPWQLRRPVELTRCGWSRRHGGRR